MRYGIYSDIHGNLEALEAVFATFEREEVERYVCLGDIVGYGASPRECIEQVLSKKSLIIAGNHDYAIAEKLSITYFSPYAKEGVLWTRQQLSPGEKQFLASLDLKQQISDELTAVHSTLHFPEMFEYIQTGYDAKLCLDFLDSPVCFFGHTHVPLAFFHGKTVSFSMEEEIPVDKKGKTLVNVGSVGQPRDENPMASCAVYDEEIGMIWIHRVEYDIESSISKINQAGLPDILGERLRYGR